MQAYWTYPCTYTIYNIALSNEGGIRNTNELLLTGDYVMKLSYKQGDQKLNAQKLHMMQ